MGPLGGHKVGLHVKEKAFIHSSSEPLILLDHGGNALTGQKAGNTKDRPAVPSHASTHTATHLGANVAF